MMAMARALLSSPSLVHQDDNTTNSKNKEMCKQHNTNGSISLHNININSDNYLNILKSCKCLVTAKQIHTHVLKCGLHENKLITMYANCSSMADARLVFDKTSEKNKNLFSWSTMIGAYARHGRSEQALQFFQQLHREEGLEMQAFVFPSVIKACAELEVLQRGKEIHCYLIKMDFVSDVFVCNALVDMYGKCGCFEDARQVFDEMPQRDLVSWNAVVSGYARNGCVDEGLGMFREMQGVGGSLKPDLISWNGIIGGFNQSGHGKEGLELFGEMQRANVRPNSVTIVGVLSACAHLGALEQGKGIHGYAVKRELGENVFVGNGLIELYRNCGDIEDARKVFDGICQKNKMSWNTMIAGYSQRGDAEEALKLFRQMELNEVKQSVVSWNAMIAGYAQNGYSEDALKLFQEMRLAGLKPTSFTFGGVLLACANLTALDHGRQIHSCIIVTGFESSVVVGSALVDMYSKSNSIEDACQVFDRMTERNTISWNAMITGYAQNKNGGEALKLFKHMQLAGVKPDVVSWNTMITGYAQNGHGNGALRLFNQMQLAGIKPDSFTYGSVLQACSRLGALDHGREIHAHMIRNGFLRDIYGESVVIDMYAKCGSIENARRVFDKRSQSTVVLWNTMIGGYAIHGCGKEALSIFYEMQKTGVKPDRITFICVLCACSHAGLIDEGWQYFKCMHAYYYITPTLEHYTCMVDLLGRAGQLNEAYNFIRAMPLEPDAFVWGSLLGACRVHCNTELGEIAADHLFKMEPENDGNYVLLSNIYAAAGRWDDVANMRKIMQQKRLKKRPGCSWIKVKDRLHAFVAGDRSQP